ncbi:MAG TPA: hypothetical protein VMF13_18375 [Luteitalea sp.]|nr:hypothetical protein [Luteitalea sp.]
MSLQWWDDERHRFEWLAVGGDWPDDDEALRLAARMADEGAWYHGMRVLIDLRQADPVGAPSFPSFMERVPDWFRVAGAPERMAVLCGPGLGYAIGRSVSMLAESKGTDTATFLDVDAAIGWLTAPRDGGLGPGVTDVRVAAPAVPRRRARP